MPDKTDKLPANERDWPSALLSKEWQDEVRATLSKRNISQNQMARDLGISSGGLTQALSDEQVLSRYVYPVSRYLDIELPVLERFRRVIDTIRETRPHAVEAIARAMEAVAGMAIPEEPDKD